MNRSMRMSAGLLGLAMFAGACGGSGDVANDVAVGDTVDGESADSTAAPTTAPATSESATDSDDNSGSGGLQSSASSNGDTESNRSTETTEADEPEESTTTEAVVDEGEQVGVFTLNVGDCLGDVPLDQISSVTELSCDNPHIYEIYHAFDISGDVYPGDDEVVAEAQEVCLDRFEGFVGIDYTASELEISYLYPTSDSWSLGDDREVLCMVLNLDGSSRSGSAEGLEI